MDITKFSRSHSKTENFISLSDPDLKDKTGNIALSILQQIEKIPLRNKILYLVGGISLFCVFAFVLRLLVSPKEENAPTFAQRTLVTNEENELKKIEKALRSLPTLEGPLGKSIYVFFHKDPFPYIWFQEGDGEFYKYRDEYAKNYSSIILLGIPLNEEASKQIERSSFFKQACHGQSWLKEFCQENRGDGKFPGHHITLTYEEYLQVLTSNPQRFPDRIQTMFVTNNFPPAW